MANYCVGIVPPSVVHIPPSYLYFITTLSPSLPESVWSPPSSDRPPAKEWVLVGVADSSQLGSVQRMREKMIHMQQRAIREVEAGRQALQEAQSQQALDQRVQDAEVRARDLQTQLEASQDVCQELNPIYPDNTAISRGITAIPPKNTAIPPDNTAISPSFTAIPPKNTS